MNNLKLTFATLFLLFMVMPANAIVLRGVVAEVRDGETIIVMSNKQKVTVILKGVDAPELKQEFGEMAQQHLAALVLNKMVEVDFTELRAGSLVGKVICNNADIGLQVIRDGVAWYAAKSDHNLSEAERSVYLEAEQVARNERRGLWEDGTPMPPWEWRRAQTAKNTRTTYKANRSPQSLNREDILFAKRPPAAVTPSGTAKSKSSLPKPTTRPLNTPGLDYDFRPYLSQGRVSIVYFYADWCPSCRQTNPVMDEINKQIPDMQVLFMNIGEWNTPVAQQYGVSYVPYLMIYDKSGNLVASGRDARAWLAEALRQRM
jgi:endonuclease YncB( thermonuclease family)/thiol-disulfide isomerase/thioredoxin